jgi:hypothetical protein
MSNTALRFTDPVIQVTDSADQRDQAADQIQIGTIEGWQAGFLSVLPAIQTHARMCFRSLKALDRAEAIQEAVASACVAYRSLAARGRLHVAHPGTLAKYAVKRVRGGRHVGSRQDAAGDVMSPAAGRRHSVKVVSFDSPARDDRAAASHGREDWRHVAVEDRRVSVPDLAAFRVDFEQWLRTLSSRDRRIIGALASGDGTSTVADRFGCSSGRISQLRRKYEQLWRVFQGEAA